MSFVSLTGTAIGTLKSSTSQISKNVQIEHLSGEEQLSGLFRYTVQFQLVEPDEGGSESADAESTGSGDGGDGSSQSSGTSSKSELASFDSIVGQDIQVVFSRTMGVQGDSRTRTRTVRGIVTRIRQHGTGKSRENLGTTSYRVEVRPKLWRLRFSKTNRTFADCSVVKDTSGDDSGSAVLNSILDEHGLSFQTDLQGSYPTRKLVTQNGETDLELFNRVAEEAGVVYRIGEGGDIVLSDHDGAYDQFARWRYDGGKDKDNQWAKKHTLEPIASSIRTDYEKALLTYSFEQNLIPSALTAQSVDYDKSTTVAKTTSSLDGGDGQATEGTVREAPGGLDWYESKKPNKVWSADSGSPDMKGLREDQLQAAQKVLRGTTPARLLGAGSRFTLRSDSCGDVVGHFAEADSMEFVVGRMLVETKGNKCDVEFEAFPIGDPTKEAKNQSAPEYRGARYMGQDVDSEETQGSGGDDPYSLSAEASVGRGNQVQPGMYVATVENVPGSDTDEGKRGMVKVQLLLEEEPAGLEKERNPVVWARKLSSWAGNGYGNQFLPREGTKVAVAYPSQDAYGYPFILGGLYDGSHKMPFADEPEKKAGIRTRSHRTGEGNDKYLHNEIALIDEPDDEEIRVLSPKYRTDVTGLGEDISNKERKYFKLNITGKHSKEIKKCLVDGVVKTITKEEKSELKSKKKKVCSLKSNIEEIKSEYDLELKGGRKVKLSGSGNESWQKKSKKTKLKPKKDIDEGIKEEIKEKTVREFKNLPEEIKIRRKDMNWESLDTYEEEEKEVDKKISPEEWSKLEDKTEWKLNLPDGQTRKYTGEIWYLKSKLSDFGLYQSEWVTKVGQDLYKTSDIEPYRRAYGSIVPGRDAYRISPYKEAYEGGDNPIQKRPLSHESQSRADYVEGGAVEACQGAYQVHTFGDRIEICKAENSSASQGGNSDEGGGSGEDVFDQEMTEEWSIDELPGNLPSFKDKNPILVLNKNGSIVIQSEKGINIESKGDINIQSEKDINIGAQENVEVYSKHVGVSSMKKTVIDSIKKVEINGEKKVDMESRSIEIGSEEETESVTIEAKVINLMSEHLHKEQEVLEINNEQLVQTNAIIHNSNTTIHSINTVMGTKAAVLDTQTPIFDNKNTVFEVGNLLMKESKKLVADRGSLAGIKDGLMKTGKWVMNYFE